MDVRQKLMLLIVYSDSKKVTLKLNLVSINQINLILANMWKLYHDLSHFLKKNSTNLLPYVRMCLKKLFSHLQAYCFIYTSSNLVIHA